MAAARGQAPGQLSLFDLADLEDGPGASPGAPTSAELFGDRADARPGAPGRPARLEDFGAKIGGARKDLWAERSMSPDDVAAMRADEVEGAVDKDALWPRVDWRALERDGRDRAVLWYVKRVRDALPSRPPYRALRYEDRAQVAQAYAQVVCAVRDAAMACGTLADCAAVADLPVRMGWAQRVRDRWPVWEPATPNRIRYTLTNKTIEAITAARDAPLSLERSMQRRRFNFTPEESAFADARVVISELRPGMWNLGDGRLRVEQSLPGLSETRWLRVPEGFDAALLSDGTFAVSSNGTLEAAGIATRAEAEAWALARHAVPGAGGSDRAGKANPRKGPLTPPMLAGVHPQTGPDWRGGVHADGEDLMAAFGIRGGEYGNWLGDADRRASVDHAFDSLQNLAMALGVEARDVGLGGRLAIAFGARGRGGASAAVAHYEPAREVINLTKMKGAGSLAHEWVHALDDALGRACGAGGFLSENASRTRSAEQAAMADLMDAIKRRPMTEEEHVAEDARLVEAARVEVARQEGLVDELRGGMLDDIRKVSHGWRNPAAREEFERLAQAAVDEACAADPAVLDDCRDRGRAFPGYDAVVAFQRAGDKDQGYVDTNPGCRQNRRYMAASAARLRRAVENEGARVERARQALARAEEAARTRSGWEGHPTVETDFYRDAKAIDARYSGAGQQGSRVKGGHGYWDSDVELLARAGACYVKDRLAAMGVEDDYLCGHADWSAPVPTDAGPAWTSPQGAERAAICGAMDRFVGAMRTLGRLHAGPADAHERLRAASGAMSAGPDPAGGLARDLAAASQAARRAADADPRRHRMGM